MNIGKTLESLNSLISKKQRKRISRHSKFMKQQKRTLVKTLKQDKMYRQQLHNYQEDMFNSTITRISKKTKNQRKFHEEQNDEAFGDGGNDTSKLHKETPTNDTFQSTPQNSPIRELTNVKIVISKVVIDASNESNGGDHAENLSKWMDDRANEFESNRKSNRKKSCDNDC